MEEMEETETNLNSNDELATDSFALSTVVESPEILAKVLSNLDSGFTQLRKNLSVMDEGLAKISDTSERIDKKVSILESSVQELEARTRRGSSGGEDMSPPDHGYKSWENSVSLEVASSPKKTKSAIRRSHTIGSSPGDKQVRVTFLEGLVSKISPDLCSSQDIQTEASDEPEFDEPDLPSEELDQVFAAVETLDECLGSSDIDEFEHKEPVVSSVVQEDEPDTKATEDSQPPIVPTLTILKCSTPTFDLSSPKMDVSSPSHGTNFAFEPPSPTQTSFSVGCSPPTTSLACSKQSMANLSRSKSLHDVSGKPPLHPQALSVSSRAIAVNASKMGERVPSSKTNPIQTNGPTTSVPLRTKSLKESGANAKLKKHRFSWSTSKSEYNLENMSLRDVPNLIRESLTSLSSLDHSTCSLSSANVEQNQQMKQITYQDLNFQQTAGLRRCRQNGYLEIKRTSGFKNYKHYWCILSEPVDKSVPISILGGSTPTLYVFHVLPAQGVGKYKIEETSLPKMAFDLSEWTVRRVTSDGKDIRKVDKRTRYFQMCPKTSAKDSSPRQFLAVSKEEADKWTRCLEQVIEETCSIKNKLNSRPSSTELLPNGVHETPPQSPRWSATLNEDDGDGKAHFDSVSPITIPPSTNTTPPPHQSPPSSPSQPRLSSLLLLSSSSSSSPSPSSSSFNERGGPIQPLKTASRSSVDSPAGSQEMVTAASATALPSSATPISSHSQASQSFRSSGPSSVEHHYHTIDGDDFETPDSDYENPTDDWRKALAKEDLDRLGKKESQRQDVINELFNTERSHVKNLRVLDQLFYRPLMAETACTLGQHKEFVESLFPNLPDVLAWHTKCNQKMKDKVKRLGYPVGNIGDILSEMFDGANGDKLIEIGSTFTKNQKFTIEELKDRRKRDQRFDKFLIEYESKPQCRRLQLQALLPMEHQRLVKYPLLVSQLLKRSSEICDKTELDILQNCQERTRVILDNIDRRVAQAQNIHKMAEIQKNLDTTGLEKFPDSSICKEFRRVDLTKHTLLYDGILTMKLGKTKTVDLHVLLLEDCVMLLQKQDDKYLLKYHMTNSLGVSAANQANMGKACFAPIIKVSNLLIRPNATDKRSFYLLNNSPNGPQFYELATQSSTDRSQWFKHITEANNAFSSRDESQRSSGDRSGTDLSSQNGPLDGSSQPGGASNDLLGGPGYEGGKAAGRSESFKGSKTEGDRGSNEESVNKKTGGGTTSQSNDPANTSSSGQRKRLQRVEILKIAEPCPLIDPSQVVVTQGEIFMAEPILTPIEKLRRKDLEVARALEEKKQLIAEILNVPKEHFDDIADIASSQPSQDKDAREVLLAALAQAKCLSDLVNQSLNLSDEERILVGSEVSMNSSYTRNTSSSSISTREQQRPLSPSSGISGDLSTAGSGPSSLMSSKPSSSNLTTRNLNPLTLQAAGKFVSISVNLNSHLTTLLGMIQERDEERERMKQELQRSKEQVHAYLSQSTSVVTSSMSAVSPGSRPASFISVEESSGTGDLSEKGTQESGGEDDGALPTNMYENISSSDQDLPEPVTPTNAKPMEDPPASSSDDSPSSPGPYTSLNKEESLGNSPSDSDKTVTESTPTYNAEAQSLIESDPGPDVSEDSARANATSSSSTSPVQKTEE